MPLQWRNQIWQSLEEGAGKRSSECEFCHVLLYVFYAIHFRVQMLCESQGGRPGFPVPNSPQGFCGRKATPKKKMC